MFLPNGAAGGNNNKNIGCMNTYHLKFTAGYILALLITQTLAQQVNMEEGSRGFAPSSNPCAGIQTRGEVFVAVVSDLEEAGPPPTHTHTSQPPISNTRAQTPRDTLFIPPRVLIALTQTTQDRPASL